MEEATSPAFLDSSAGAPTSDIGRNVSTENKPDATMEEASSKSPRSSHLEPSPSNTKAPRTFDSLDISSSRLPPSGTPTSTTLITTSTTIINDQESPSPPETSGDQSPDY